jgi:HlyD family secretion protein
MRLQTQLLGTTVLVLLGAGCVKERDADPAFLGSAVIESRTCTVSSVVPGRLVAVYASEGQRVAAEEVVAIVDTVQLQFTRQEIAAGIHEIDATVAAKNAQIEAKRIETEGLEREFARIDGLAAKGAATVQQRDNLLTRLNAAKAGLEAARSALKPMVEKEKGLRVTLKKVDDQMRRCYITSPVGGVVLTQFREQGEVTGTGTPIADIGRFDTMYADFFVPQPVLSTLSYGKKIRIRVDWDSSGGVAEKYLPALISHIGEEAEFTPKNIQTRKTRNELVFRVRCTVPNMSGMLKRGLPVEIWR